MPCVRPATQAVSTCSLPVCSQTAHKVLAFLWQIPTIRDCPGPVEQRAAGTFANATLRLRGPSTMVCSVSCCSRRPGASAWLGSLLQCRNHMCSAGAHVCMACVPLGFRTHPSSRCLDSQLALHIREQKVSRSTTGSYSCLSFYRRTSAVMGLQLVDALSTGAYDTSLTRVV